MRNAKRKFWKPYKFIFAFILFVIGAFVIGSIANDITAGLSLATVAPLVWIKGGQFTQELTADELVKLDEKEIAVYIKELNESMYSMTNKQIKTLKDEYERELRSLKTDFEDWKAENVTNNESIKSDFDALKVYAEEIKEQVTLLKQGRRDNGIQSKEELKGYIKSIAEGLKDKASPPSYIQDAEGNKLNVSKAVGTMTFSNSVTGTMPQADREPGFNDFNKVVTVIRNSSNTGRTSANKVEWVYKAAKEGSAGMTAEGAAKTQLDWTYVVDSADVRKITSYIKISKEMLDDIEGIMSDINGELQYEIDYLEETQLITGDGTGTNLNGIEKYASALDNAALSGTVPSPNKWDVIGAAITQIEIETFGTSRANAIFMHPADIFAMVHGSKTSTYEYVAPVTVDASGTRVWGVPVISTTRVTAGEYIVADMRKFNIKDREDLTIAMGYENDDWTKNLVTILGEKRLVTYVKKNDEDAFVTDTYADGITLLTAST